MDTIGTMRIFDPDSDVPYSEPTLVVGTTAFSDDGGRRTVLARSR